MLISFKNAGNYEDEKFVKKKEHLARLFFFFLRYGWGVGSGEWGVGSGEWGVGSGLKPFWCLSLIIRLFLNLLGGCYKRSYSLPPYKMARNP